MKLDPVNLDAAFEMLRGTSIPGAAAAVVTPDGVVREEYLGVADLETHEEVTPDHAFDLASLTKVLVTVPEVLLLLEAGRLSLQDRVGLHLPEAGWMVPQGGVRDVTISQLLSHTSGLPAWAPLYTHPADRSTLLARVLQTPLEAEPGERFLYADLGFIVLGHLVERLTGKRLDELAEARGFVRYRPIASTGPADSTNPTGKIVSTERCPWRGRVLRGEVHDENAFALGGVAGHAGSFGTLRDVARAARAWLGHLVSAPTRDLMIRPHSFEPNGNPRGLGWVLGHATCSGGDLASPRAFGHTGFTGTSVWIEPDRGYAILVLTNRVHPTRHTNDDIIHLRRRFANAVHAALGR